MVVMDEGTRHSNPVPLRRKYSYVQTWSRLWRRTCPGALESIHEMQVVQSVQLSLAHAASVDTFISTYNHKHFRRLSDTGAVCSC